MPRTGASERLVHLRVTAPGLPAYWLDIEAKEHAKLEALDSFIRRTWVECCGHLSAFEIGAVRYFSDGYDLGLESPFTGLVGVGRARPIERHMNARIGDAVPFGGEPFTEFSTTCSNLARKWGSTYGLLATTEVAATTENYWERWRVCSMSYPHSSTMPRTERSN